MKKVAVVFIVLLVACSKPEDKNHLLNPKDFQEKFSSMPGAVLLDVRTAAEVQKGYIKGAINFDYNAPEFEVLMKGMDKGKTYFVYCASGVRSAKAVEKMKDMDFQEMYLLEGGIKAWTTAGLPLAGKESQ
jgi:rhodanese-related sulfurtransferase